MKVGLKQIIFGDLINKDKIKMYFISEKDFQEHKQQDEPLLVHLH